MSFITLAVTTPVIQELKSGNEHNKQIAIRGASQDLRFLLDTANAQNKISVAVCGVFELAVGDNYAIWGVHQDFGVQADDFSNLYSLLANRPDISVTFRW